MVPRIRQTSEMGEKRGRRDSASRCTNVRQWESSVKRGPMRSKGNVNQKSLLRATKKEKKSIRALTVDGNLYGARDGRELNALEKTQKN